MASQSTKRQQNFVSRTIQGSLLRRFGAYWLMYNLLIWHGMFAFHASEHPLGAGEFLPRIGQLYLNFAREHRALIWCALAILPVFLWDALRLSHRIAGPLERFRDALERLQREENVKPLTLRRDDLLVDFQRAFNRYLKQLDAQRAVHLRLFEAEEPSPAGMETDSDPLFTEVERLRAELHYLTTEGDAD